MLSSFCSSSDVGILLITILSRRGLSLPRFGFISHPSLLLKFTPSLHGNLTTIKLALVLDACLLRLFPGRLPRIAPTEIIKLPVSVSWEDKVPNGKREQIDQHPDDV
jgi:hypothetical protein